MRAVEEASLRAWPALEEAALDGWRLRFSEGFTGRANSVQPLGRSERPLADRVAECERWYARRGRPCLFRITPFAEEGVDAFLAEAGYASFNPTDVMCLDDLGALADSSVGELRAAEPSEWLETYGRMSGLHAPNPTMGRIVSEIRPASLTAVLWVDGRPVACGLAVSDGELVGLFDLVVAPDRRRMGFGAELVRGLCGWGRARGGSRAYLQVTHDNGAAWALYAKLGFRRGYGYAYRRREP